MFMQPEIANGRMFAKPHPFRMLYYGLTLTTAVPENSAWSENETTILTHAHGPVNIAPPYFHMLTRSPVIPSNMVNMTLSRAWSNPENTLSTAADLQAW